MKTLSKTLLLTAWLCALLGLTGLAGAATLTVGTASGQVGDTVEVPVDLSGLGGDTVWSVEMDLTWYGLVAQCVGVVTAGTLTESWLVDFSPGSGTLTVSAAGGVPLTGDGALMRLQFLLGPNSGGTTLTLAGAIMNEGEPVPVRVNGYLTATALPTINVSPDTGLLAVGQTLAFGTSGGTAPYTYTSSNPAVAGFTGNLLTALAPGLVAVESADDNGLTNTTTGNIEVRAFTLDLAEVAVTVGNEVWVPVTIGDPGPFGIVSGEFAITWTASYATFTGLETVGTLMGAAGWSALTHEPAPGALTVAASGATALSGGGGTLCFLKFLASNTTTLYLGTTVFNEVYPAVPLNGSISVTQLPVIYVSPGTANLVVGDDLQFNVTGSPTPPFTWSVDDPAVAVISPDGLLTAVGEGTAVVHVVDTGGSQAWSGTVSVCGLAVPALSSAIMANETVSVPVQLDRVVDGLDLYSYEMSVGYDPGSVAFVGAVVAASLTEDWGAPLVVDHGTSISVYHAGPTPLTGCGPQLVFLEFQGAPGLVGTYSGLSLQGALFNEGTPCVRINYGDPCEAVAVGDLPVAGLHLWPNHPNPFNPRTTIDFTVEKGGSVRLTVYSSRGSMVRELFSGDAAAGERHSVDWDGRNSQGRLVPSGAYYYRLTSAGASRVGKMMLLK